MKQFASNAFLFITLILLFFLLSCKNNKHTMDDLSDAEFIRIISGNRNSTKGLARIDSIIKTDNSFSIHKNGLLYYNKAEYLFDLNKLDIAAINYSKSLELFEKENSKKFIGIAHSGLGRVNTNLKKIKIAIKHQNTALDIFKNLNDKQNELAALDGIAYIYFSVFNYTEARKIVKKLEKINFELKDSIGLSKNYSNLGYLSELINDKKAAEEYYKKAVTINKSMNYASSTVALRNLGSYYLSINKIDKCASLYLKALEIENKRGNLQIQKEIYSILLDSIKNYKIRDLYKLKPKKDSINKLLIEEENKEKIKLVEDQYKLIAKEKELKQQQELNKKNRFIFAIVTGLLFFIGLFFFQRNKNKRLKLKQDKLVLEQKVLRTQMNPHFIFNALTSIQKTIFDDDPLKSATYLSKFAKLIRQNFDFVSKTEILLSDDLDALKNYMDTQQLRFDHKFSYEIKIDEDINPSQINIPPMLIQPFIENAIEHGLKPKAEKGLLEIIITRKDHLFQFIVKDDGVGFTKTRNENNREHSSDIFLKRLKLRNLGEEKYFSFTSQDNNIGTIVRFCLKLKEW